jgi:hypothetical protein
VVIDFDKQRPRRRYSRKQSLLSLPPKEQAAAKRLAGEQGTAAKASAAIGNVVTPWLWRYEGKQHPRHLTAN